MGVRPFFAASFNNEMTPDDLLRMHFSHNANLILPPGRSVNRDERYPSIATAIHFPQHNPIPPPVFSEPRFYRLKYACKQLAFLALKVLLIAVGVLGLFRLGAGIYNFKLSYIVSGIALTIISIAKLYEVDRASTALAIRENLRRAASTAAADLVTLLNIFDGANAPFSQLPQADQILERILLGSLAPLENTTACVEDVNFITAALGKYRDQLPIVSDEELPEPQITQTIFTEHLTLEGIIQAPYIVILEAIEQNRVPKFLGFIRQKIENFSIQYNHFSREEENHFQELKNQFLANVVKELGPDEELIDPQDEDSVAMFFSSVSQLQADFIRYPGSMKDAFKKAYQQLGAD